MARLFALLALLQLVPIWAVHYLPTMDGPAHVYNSWIVHELIAGRGAQLSRFFAINWQPIPNWTDHAVMALLMFVVPPLVAEKIFVSLIVLAVLTGAWLYARSPAFAFLAFPLLFHQLLLQGFYNFSLSLGLYFIVVGLWWRERSRGLIAALLVLCYFTHPMAAMLGVGTLLLLWLLKRRPRDLLALVPVCVLLAWYVAHQPMAPAGRAGTPSQLFEALRQTQILFNFDLRQFTFGKLYFATLIVLAVATIVRERRLRAADVFLLLTISLVIAYIRSPGIVAGGMLVAERTSLFVYLAPLAWFSPRLPKAMRYAVAGIFSIVAVVNAGFHLHHFRHYDRVVADYLKGVQPVPRHATILPLLFSGEMPGSYVSFIVHAVEYAAVEKELVDFENYEPLAGQFPVVYAPGVALPKPSSIAATAATYDFAAANPRPEYVFLWRATDNAVLDNIGKSYALISERDGGRLYR